MKFSTPYIVFAFALYQTAFAVPVDANNLDLVKRGFNGPYEVETRGYDIDALEKRDPEIATALGLDERSEASASATCRPGSRRTLLEKRTEVGQTITISGKNYKLVEDVSGTGGDKTFKIEGGQSFAKRPSRKGTPPAEFTTEISNTKKASDALRSGLWIADGTFGDYTWLIVQKMSGAPIQDRWLTNPGSFPTRKSCDDDITAAKAVIKAQQEVLVRANVGVHADSHPGNWFLNLSGRITTALPIDFGRVWPVNTDIDKLLNDQYKFSNADWETFKSCGICK